jgi:multidrug resistance efflux pump
MRPKCVDVSPAIGADLLQNVKATFEWVRLAQRIPVRIKLVVDISETSTVTFGYNRQNLQRIFGKTPNVADEL